MKFFAQAESRPTISQTGKPENVGLEDLTVPFFPLLGAAVVIISAVSTGMIWLGQLQQRLNNTQEDMEEMKDTLVEIKGSLESIVQKIETGNKEVKKELLAEIKKQAIQSENNVDSAFKAPLISITLKLDYLNKKLSERDQTLNQIKSGLNRIGSEAREAKTLARLAWEVNCGNGPPSKPQTYS